MIILDTDYIQALLYEGPLKSRIIYELETRAAGHQVGTTLISFQENIEGWLRQSNDGRKSVIDQVPYYKSLRGVLELYQIWDFVLPFDEPAAHKFNELRESGVTTAKVKSHDLKIGAIALCNDATLLTRNTQHFQHIPGLDVHDWLIE